MKLFLKIIEVVVLSFALMGNARAQTAQILRPLPRLGNVHEAKLREEYEQLSKEFDRIQEELGILRSSRSASHFSLPCPDELCPSLALPCPGEGCPAGRHESAQTDKIGGYTLR